MALCFVYKWTHLPTLMWYVGSRIAKGCHPEDGYICSSKTVKEMIIEDATQWKREIIATGEAFDMIDFETELLQLVDAKNDPRSFNRHNGDGKFTSTGKIVSKKTKEIMSNNRKGVAKLNTHKDAIANSVKEYLTTNPRAGETAPRFKGYYVSPIGEKFATSKEAALKYNCNPTTIGNWVKSERNGWKFSPVEMI